MNINLELFKDVQSKIFQTKEIEHYAALKVEDPIGGIKRKPSDVLSGKYMVNLQVITDSEVAMQFGLIAGKDVCITSSQALPISKGDYILWQNNWYQIEATPQRDYYTELYAKQVTV